MSTDWLPFRLGETFTRDVILDAASIRAFAMLTGDSNPLHHDESAAARSRFGRLIASGSQTASLLASMTAAIVTERCDSLGLEIAFRFRAAVLVDEPMRMEVELVEIVPKPQSGRYLLTFKCRMIVASSGVVSVEGHVKTLIFRSGEVS